MTTREQKKIEYNGITFTESEALDTISNNEKLIGYLTYISELYDVTDTLNSNNNYLLQGKKMAIKELIRKIKAKKG